jgi:hypothetical protein
MSLLQSNRLSPDLEGAGDHTRSRGDMALPPPVRHLPCIWLTISGRGSNELRRCRRIPEPHGNQPVPSGGLAGSTGIADNWIPLSAFRIIATNEAAACGSNSVPARSSM